MNIPDSKCLEGIVPQSRKRFHENLFVSVLRIDKNGVPNNADKGNKPSVQLAKSIVAQIKEKPRRNSLSGQQAGSAFEEVCAEYLRMTFGRLSHIRPGEWDIGKAAGDSAEITRYEQYQHLAAVNEVAASNEQLAAALGRDYLIKPDVVIARIPERDEVINSPYSVVSEDLSLLAALRKSNNPLPILHASVSCKWTLRSDRAQNARSEALNLIRNRKGKLPHIVVVTGEPTPSRLASLALGTGDIDCVYHFALPELQSALRELEMEDSEKLLQVMVNGKRLKDISDLPLDLAV